MRHVVGIIALLSFSVSANAQWLSIDTTPPQGVISLSELLRAIQFFNSSGLHCQAGTEDGYAPGVGADHSCAPNSLDYNPQDWSVSLSELLRAIQFYNSTSYYPCPDQSTEDGFCPGAPSEGEGEGEGQTCVLDTTGWIYNATTTHWYKRTEVALNWPDANAQATVWCGYLVTINDANENQFLFTSGLLDNSDTIWIGLNAQTTPGTYTWADGEPVTYTNWLTGQPDNLGGTQNTAAVLGIMHQAAGTWIDEDPTLPYPALIERNFPPDASGGE